MRLVFVSVGDFLCESAPLFPTKKLLPLPLVKAILSLFSEAAYETYTEHNVLSTQGYLCGHVGIAILGGKPTKVLAQVQKKWNGRGLKAVLLILDQIKTRQC